jgi:hypothetical protein
MAQRGDKWVDDLVNSINWPRIESSNPATRKEAARKQLKEMVALLNEQDGEPVPPRPPDPVVKTLFDQPGWFAVRYDRLPSPGELVDARIEWIAAILSHGVDGNGNHSMDNDDKENQAFLAAGRHLPYKNVGIKIGGWGWCQGFHAMVEADIADTYQRAWNLDFWIANGEEAWKNNTQPEIFADTIYGHNKNLPVGWSTLGAAAGKNVFPFMYASFTNRGYHILAQSYPQETADYELDKCLDHAERAGIPKRFFHYTIANYGAANRPTAYRPTMQQWEEQLMRASVRHYDGVSFWDHQWVLEDVKKLAQI